MALSFKDLCSAEIKKIGQELSNARELLNKTSSDFVLDLRTTRHHINAIESGELRIFYGAPFYLDLMKRYARQINFSEEKIEEFESRVLSIKEKELLDEIPPNLINNERKTIKKNSNSEIYKKNIEKTKLSKIKNTSVKKELFHSYSSLRLENKEIKKIVENNNLFLKYLLLIVFAVLGFVYYFGNNEKQNKIKTVSNLNSIVKEGSTLKQNDLNKFKLTKKIEKNSKISESNKIANSSFINVDNSDYRPTKNSEDIATKELNSNKNYYISLQNEKDFEEKIDNQEDVPDVIFDIKKNTWLWIKYSDESVKEFTVNANDRVTIEKLPIYLVIGNPDSVVLTVKGKIFKLQRNDPERNITRLTRTQLINFSL